MGDGHERVDPAAPAVVIKPAGKDLGFAQAFQHPRASAEFKQHRTQLEAKIAALALVEQATEGLNSEVSGSVRDDPDVDPRAVHGPTVPAVP